MLLLNLGNGRAVGATHVIGGDLQIRNRIGARRPAEDEVAILLVGVGLLRALFDLDQPRIDERALPLSAPLNSRSLVPYGDSWSCQVW